MFFRAEMFPCFHTYPPPCLFLQPPVSSLVSILHKFCFIPCSGLSSGNRLLTVILGTLDVFLVDPRQSSDLLRHARPQPQEGSADHICSIIPGQNKTKSWSRWCHLCEGSFYLFIKRYIYEKELALFCLLFKKNHKLSGKQWRHAIRCSFQLYFNTILYNFMVFVADACGSGRGGQTTHSAEGFS